MNDETAAGRWLGAYLLFTTASTGALVMVVEVLGSRVIGPFFGVSLFVWTALITVTLLALAAGYAVGGWLSDRRPSPSVLYGLIVAAGVFVAATPLLKAPVLTAALTLGLRSGAFASALVLFGPPLFLLGCVSPYVVRIAAKEWGRLGRTVGVFYAVSTAGSFVGTLVTGFFLIAYVGVAQAFFYCGLLLVALGAGYFAFVRRRPAALALPALALVLLPATELPQLRLPDGTEVRVVHSEDSYYGNIKVVDYRHGDLHTRELVIDGLVQGGIDLGNRLSVYEYPYLLQHLPVALNPGGESCLVIGVGAAVVPAWYEARGVKTDVVDIDPRVVEAARRHFGYAPAGDVHIEDARAFLARIGPRYDYVILDVFGGDTTPGHLLTVEALRLLKARLKEGGVVAINLMGSVGPDGEMTRAVADTLRAVFRHVRFHAVFEPEKTEGVGNFVVVALDGPVAGTIPADVPVHPLAVPLVRAGLAGPVPVGSAGIILTDDFNPLDVRDIGVKERVRRQILESTPAPVLLSATPANRG